MAALFQRNEVTFERFGVTVTVSDNDVARLMYYLSCVCTAIDCNHDQSIQRFTNYKNWTSLSIEEQKALIVVCYTFSPDVLDDKVFFHSDALCGNSRNEFYKINQVRHQILAAESIVIAGRVREVNQIMTYKMGWMQTFYFEPMQRLVRIHSSSRPAITHTPTYTPTFVRQPSIRSSSSKCTAGRICCVVYCVLFVIPGIIGLIIGISK